MEIINRFKGEYDFLSNFYTRKFTFDNREYLNAEAAFQSMKCLRKEYRDTFSNQDPSAAKRHGRNVELRKDWEQVKDNITAMAVHAKFSQNPDLVEKLVVTGDTLLIAGNTWNDRYWGVCNGVGENKLGKILMKEREYLKKHMEDYRTC